MQKIGVCLWFDDQAEAAAKFYCSVFESSKVLETTYYLESAHKPAGTVLTVKFVLDGQEITALNGGPEFKLSPAISMTVSCETQEEVDTYWEKLCEGGQEVECGWLTDKFGLSWQIVPQQMLEMLSSKDKEAAKRAVQAMYKMKKLDIAKLESAFQGA